MKRKQINTALIELIIVILFFALSATLIIQVMTSSYRIAHRTEDKSILLIEAQNLIETIKSDPFHSNMNLKDQGLEYETDTDGYDFYYDQTITPSSKIDAVYEIRVDLQNQQQSYGTMVTITLSAYNVTEQESLFQIETMEYVSSSGGQ